MFIMFCPIMLDVYNILTHIEHGSMIKDAMFV